MWRQLVDDTGLDLTSVAVDVQGPGVVRPWAEPVAASFRTLVDSRAELTERMGVAVVPFVLVFEDGRLQQPITAINVLDEAQADAVRRWATGHATRIELPILAERSRSRDTEAASAWLSVARMAIEEDRRGDALTALERGFVHEPGNWLIRKQRWALEEPDRFYAGDIDAAWQDEQCAAGR